MNVHVKSPKHRGPIHPSIKTRLGYREDDPDDEVLRDWRARLARVCKPCWELKYCPYGPLVEQSPLLPSERDGAVEHNDRLKRVLAENQLGGIEKLSEDRRRDLEEWVQDEEILTRQVLYEMSNEARDAFIAAEDDPTEVFKDLLSGPLPSIEKYRIPFDYREILGADERIEQLTPEQQREARKRVRQRRKTLAKALETGLEDTRRPLDAARRGWFEELVRDFRPEDHPEHIPGVFADGQCSVFGHVCPVFFAAEAFTETTEERRRGRYIPFATKMRVVRRDNHTCQHCQKHLADPEVEFDHKIPISKGGSSEEHNIRLTCFDCNREKRDKVEI